VAGTRLISIVGKKNAGKTSLVVALASEFTRKGHRVMTIKHGTHAATIDSEGRDTWRHYNEGKAERVLMESPGQRVLFERADTEQDPVSLARRFLGGADIVLVEGFKAYRLPKIEVFRKAVHEAPLYDPEGPTGKDWVAIVTDDVKYRASIPVLRFTDTAWLMTLSRVAWDKAFVADD
jgi:molybdopterin-guanine dinucleotide biosynthesis protein MobB